MDAERRDWYELYRIPATIWPDMVSSMEEHGNVARAWVQALFVKFSGRSLIDVLRQPKLSPFCLRESESIKEIQVCTVLAEDCTGGGAQPTWIKFSYQNTLCNDCSCQKHEYV
jgi:hypothetical protein